MEPRVAILCATELEQRPLREALEGLPVHWLITGMGAGAAAAAATRVLSSDGSVAMVVQAGIAGAFDRSLAIGGVVMVGSDFQADLGACRSETGAFEPFGSVVAECPFAAKYAKLLNVPTVTGQSANTACTPLVSLQAQVESMEGAAFFEVCSAFSDVEFLQLRAISNYVGDPRTLWDIDGALASLSGILQRLFYV